MTTIVTLGGGGFSSTEGELTPLDHHLLDLARGRTRTVSGPVGAVVGGPDRGARPRVCFVPTASGDAATYCQKFERAYAGVAETSVLSLFNAPGHPYRDPAVLLEQDLVFVGGGSTANLLALWRLHGLPEVLTEAGRRGVVLAGISAGMNCWFEGSSTDSFGALAALPDGLGMLRGSACPHYDGEPGRPEQFRAAVGSGELPEGYAADDHVALVWRDGELVEAVAERAGARAFRVAADGRGGAVETPVPVRLLA